MAACAGEWAGHVQNASVLCAGGWHVCSPHNMHLLKEITWRDATGVSGCYAFNAAQDNGDCRPCLSSLQQVSVELHK